MSNVTRPVLAKQEVRELAKTIPNNVWIQAIRIEASRQSRADEAIVLPGFSRGILDVRRAYPNMYIPGQTIYFSTPIEATPESHNWEDFLKALEVGDELCNGYQYLEAMKEHVDRPFSDRLFVKELMLVEAEKTHPNYHDFSAGERANPSMRANGGRGDPFYDGVRCAFAHFVGTYQILGEGVEAARNGLMPGQTRIPMNLVTVKVVRTKHVENWAHAKGRAYARGKNDVILYDEDKIVRNASVVKQHLPTCCRDGIIIPFEMEGSWKNYQKFDCETSTLKRYYEEDE